MQRLPCAVSRTAVKYFFYPKGCASNQCEVHNNWTPRVMCCLFFPFLFFLSPLKVCGHSISFSKQLLASFSVFLLCVLPLPLMKLSFRPFTSPDISLQIPLHILMPPLMCSRDHTIEAELMQIKKKKCLFFLSVCVLEVSRNAKI